MRRLLLLALPCLFVAPAAIAGTLYKCTDARGHVSYRDTPCPPAARQEILRRFPDPGSVPAAPSVPAATVPPAPAPDPAPPPRVARTPPPRLYRCTRATDGETYLSRTGRTRPYLVPSGMLDWQRPLAEVYGSRQGAGVGMSAPELMPDPTPRMIGGGYYVRVRDICRRLPPRAACAALREQYEANEEDIDRAFKSERGPLLERREQLRARMAGCP